MKFQHIIIIGVLNIIIIMSISNQIYAMNPKGLPPKVKSAPQLQPIKKHPSIERIKQDTFNACAKMPNKLLNQK